MRIFDWLDSAVRAVAAFLMVVMTALVLLEVFCRYLLGKPLGATQELSVMCMVWIAMLGTATAVRRGSHVAVTLLVDVLPPVVKRVTAAVSSLVMLAFFYLMISQGWPVVVRGMRQASTVTGIRHGYVALAIPVCGALSILYLLDMIVFRRRRAGKAAAGGVKNGEESSHA